MLKAFHEKLILFTSKPRWDDRPVKEYEVGNDWLGNILLGFLGSAESYKCRGTISGIGVDEAYSLVTFSTQTAWAPMTDMWDAIIESCFSDECGRPQLSYVYVAEEPNMDIFINTDINHEIFKEMYLLDDGDSFYEYVGADEVDEFCDRFRDEYNLTGETIEELVESYNQTHKDCEIELHKFEEE